MKIEVLAFDSFGVRSMATFIRTDVKILIDPGVALGPSRYGLPPHEKELEREAACWEEIKKYAKMADILVLSHYHYDHHDPTYPELYEGKILYMKHPTAKINRSQKERAKFFLDEIEGKPKKMDTGDGKEFLHRKTLIRFSNPVFHGIGPRLGWVIETYIEYGKSKLIHTSDVQGPSIQDQLDFILENSPDSVILDGPMTYMLGYRYPQKNVDLSVENMIRMIDETPVKTIITDHHFLRDLKYKERIKRVYDRAGKEVKIITAAEYAGREIELLEARRKELYKTFPSGKKKYTRFADV
jgi:hypothetical protein